MTFDMTFKDQGHPGAQSTTAQLLYGPHFNPFTADPVKALRFVILV